MNQRRSARLVVGRDVAKVAATKPARAWGRAATRRGTLHAGGHSARAVLLRAHAMQAHRWAGTGWPAETLLGLSQSATRAAAGAAPTVLHDA